MNWIFWHFSGDVEPFSHGGSGSIVLVATTARDLIVGLSHRVLSGKGRCGPKYRHLGCCTAGAACTAGARLSAHLKIISVSDHSNRETRPGMDFICSTGNHKEG